MRYIGIDPGASGGIACLLDVSSLVSIDCLLPTGLPPVPVTDNMSVILTSMPDTKYDILELFKYYGPHGPLSTAVSACIEKVGGYIGGGPPCPVCRQPRNRSPGSSMFKFGEGYGALQAFLIATDISSEEVTPQKWQKAMGISTKKKSESKTEFKNRIKSRAQAIYPSLKITLATCDALLIATYWKRKNEGTL